MIKIKIPFIEKNTHGTLEYNEPRSFRYFYHHLKGLLSSKEAEIYTLEEIFMAHIVMPLPNGQTTTMGDQLTQQLASGNTPALEGFEVVSTDTNPALEEKKGTLILKKVVNPA